MPAQSKSTDNQLRRQLLKKTAATKATASPFGSPYSSRAQSRNVSDDEDFDDNASVDSWALDMNTTGMEQLGLGDKGANSQDSADGSGLSSSTPEGSVIRLKDALEVLSEKRVSIRLAALNTIVNVLAHNYLPDELDDIKVSILDSLKRCLKKPKQEKEAILAIQGIAIWFVIFGDGEESMYNDVRPALEDLVSNSKSVATRAQAMNALAISNFIAVEDFNNSIKIVKLIEAALTPPKTPDGRRSSIATDPRMLTQALSSFGFMLTLVGQINPGMVKDLFATCFERHLQLLESDSLSVRMASAQNLAFIHDHLTENRAGLGYMKQERLINTLQDMLRDSNKKVKQKDRAQQRSILRDVIRTMTNNDPPLLKLKFRNKIVSFDHWTQILRVYTFRDTLGTGFHTHFMFNPLVQAIFGVSLDIPHESEVMTTERVVVDPGSELAKARTLDMKHKREKRRLEKQNMIFGNEDDDDL
ncbi:Interferon- developmental regulator 1 [Mycoemilia scoparia]|uniref:Interferon- developmental regulator 1 n=1 Tax=Mycoemilia scoparia TaxID=417184 RepID=A0A9W8A1L4_9FUNG|nr:Interferon- developmental regulator 1 [Mycoemilia scoparia]